MTCSCGWDGLGSEFGAHRRSVDAEAGHKVSDLDPASSVWKRARK